jgi:PKD repeat protein
MGASVMLTLASCYQESRLLVHADFVVTVENDNHTAPVHVALENTSTGADFYEWTFEGGSPATSSEKTPKEVAYKQAGSYKVMLKAWNDHEQDTKEYTLRVDSAVTVSFGTEIEMNDFAPAKVRITNQTRGASTFVWTFEGGQPEESDEPQPGEIAFDKPGEHRITVMASNGGETFTLSKSITLRPALQPDFDIEPTFDDFDYEVPFTASLANKTVSGLTYRWETTGGTLDDATAEHPRLSITTPGTYTVTLTAENGKESKEVRKEVTVKANSNLYTMRDVKFGIKSAAGSIGAFYSLDKRMIIPQPSKGVSGEIGKEISLVFFGINFSFEKCYFTSPDRATDAGFYAIPNATKTYIVNTLEQSPLTFSASDFDAMVDDTPLKGLDIKTNDNPSGWFIANPVPRVVLFETSDGRRGAIKIKAFVSEQSQSYILTDLKFQKRQGQ